MRVETLEKGFPADCGVPKITVPYAQFIKEVLGCYGLGYACTIQSFSVYSLPDLYECILL